MTPARRRHVCPPSKERREGAGGDVHRGMNVAEAQRGGTARISLGGKIEKQPESVVEKPKKEKKEKQPETPLPVEPAFRPLDQMSEDDMMQEYENNEQAIGELLTTNPDIDSIFEELTRLEQEMEDVKGKIDNAKRSRDATTDKRKRQGIVDFLEGQETRRDQLKPLIADLKTKTQRLRKTKGELDSLRERQKEIESRL